MTRSISQRKNYNQSRPSSLCEQELVSCWFLSIWCPEENLDRGSAFSRYQPPPQQMVVRDQPSALEQQPANYEINDSMDEEEGKWPSIERTYSFDDWSEDSEVHPTATNTEEELIIPRSFTFDEWDSREDTEVHANGLGYPNDPSDKRCSNSIPSPKDTYLFRPIQHGRPLSPDTTTSTSKTLSTTTSAGSDRFPSIVTSSPSITTPTVEECRGIQRCTAPHQAPHQLLDDSIDNSDTVLVESSPRRPVVDYERGQQYPQFLYDLPQDEQGETTTGDNITMQPPIPRVIYVPRPRRQQSNNHCQWRRQLVRSWRRMVSPRQRDTAAWKCPKPSYRQGYRGHREHHSQPKQGFRRNNSFQRTRSMGEF